MNGSRFRHGTMNAVRVTLFAGIGLLLFLFQFVPTGPGRTPPIVSSPAPSPRVETSRAFHPLVSRSLDRPVPDPRPAPRSATGSADRPTWPDGWPSLVPVRSGPARQSANGIQTMGSGPIDLYVPATTDPSATDTEGDDDEADGEDDEDDELEMVRENDETSEQEVGRPEGGIPDGIDHVGEVGEVAGEDLYDDLPPRTGDEAADAEDENLERLGQMMRDRWEEDGDDAGEAPADPDPFGPDPAEVGDEADEADDAPPSDPFGPDPAPAEEEEDGDPGAGGEVPAEETAGDAQVPPPPGPGPGYTLFTPEGRPVSNVILSQPFFVELRVIEEEDPGTETLDVAVRDEDGNEQTIVLHRDEEGSGNGTVRFVTRDPVSLAGEWGRNVFSSPFSRYEGTVDELDIDLDETGGSAIVRLASRDNVTGGFSTFGVYGDQVQLGLKAVEQELDYIETYLRDERQVAEATANNEELPEELRSEARSWLERIDNHQRIVDAARRELENQELPMFKLVYASELLGLIKNHDPAGGPPVRDRIVPSRGTSSIGEALKRARNRLADYETKGIVPPVAMDVIEGYLLGTYSAFAHLTGGAAVFKLFEGTDEFGREGSRVAALVEIGALVALVWLPPKIVDYLAGGGELGMSVRFGRGNRGMTVDLNTPGATMLPGSALQGSGLRGRPPPDADLLVGQIRQRSRGGQARSGAEPVPARPGRVTAETAGGQLPYPGTRGANRGLPTSEVTYWRGRSGQRADEYLVQMDRVVTEARRRGVSDDAIEAALREARDRDVVDAVNFLEGRLEIEVAFREGERVFIGRPDRDLIQGFIDEGDDAISAAHLERMSTTDLDVLESVISKAHLKAKWEDLTPRERQFVESIVRRVDEGQDLASWKVADIDEMTITGPDGDVLVTGHQFEGVEPMFRQGDIEAILTVFGERVPGVRGGRSAGPPVRGIEQVITRPAGKRWGHLGEATVDEAFGNPGLPDDAWVHFGGSEIAEAVAQQGVRGLTGRSFWFRWGEIKNMTQGELRWKIGESATSGLSDLRTMVVAPEGAPIRSVPGNYGLKVEGVIDIPVTGGRVIVAPPDVAAGARTGAPASRPPRPLSSLDDYTDLVARQNAGETLDLSGIARPGIVTSVMEGKLGLGQGAGRWDNTRPDGWLDVFVRAETKIPDGIELRVLETGVSAEVVRTTNLLSSRGAAGTNPTLINAIVPEGSRWTRVQVRARDVRVRTSDTQRFVESEIARLRDEGVDVGLLEEALAPLAPIERMRVLRDPAARARALRTGVAEPPPAGPTRVVDPAADPAAFGGPSGRSGPGPIEAVFRSTGGSTGGVIEMFLVNHGDEDLRIRTEGLVLEPVDVDDPDDPRGARIEQIIEAATSGKTVPSPMPAGGGTALSLPPEWRGARVVRVVVDAYCLEFERTVPGAGEVFQLADRETQETHAPARSIVSASRALHQAGRLQPDTDPEDYYHSITQWAIWVNENSLDRAGFERDFVVHARRNVEAARQEWNDRVEAVVRSLMPGRWDDVTMVLRAAGLSVSSGSS